MKITALDIRQKTFEKAFRGLDQHEVQAFLLTLSQQWERMGDENRELRLKLEHATQEVQKMREVETSLYRTLKTAEDTGNSITEQASRDAELRVREAQLKADQLLSDARQRARSVLDDAYKQAEKTVVDMQTEVNGLGQECQRLEQVLEGLVRDLQRLGTDALAKVEKAQARPKPSTAAILSRAANVKVNRPEPSPETPSPVFISSSSSSAAAAIAPTAPGAPAGRSIDLPTDRPIGPQPGQNPQPQPGAPEFDPTRPSENPGVSEPSRIYQPEPARVPEPTGPQVEPTRPDIQPVGPSRPEIEQPSPAPQPGGNPGMVVAEPVEAEKSFFDEI
ncbi:DivIVA domain-containing protein [Hymenobacter sp. BT175]|uniref:DivIVA domain-containing protein n=1 Tax=Hymenobacter translucens TaxID=2886507 RepID=UPI001D0F1389|nr:DivIVA domain-containing protein [Hymenobacter translucens]MCC2546955.1 DivIVA domain-containing protein [Hymenobacter translucens]